MNSQPSSPGDPVELALALCHEVGNLLAAARLSAYLLGREPDARQVAAGAGDIETLAVQAGALTVHIRSLLSGGGKPRVRLAPGALLRGVERALTQATPRAPAIEISAREDLPHVEVDGDALHHLLVTLLLSAWDADGEEGRVRLSVDREGDQVVFAVEDDGRPWKADAADARMGPRGRSLFSQVGATLVARWGGELHASACPAGNRVEVRLPACER